MNRINKKFIQLKRKRKKALITFITAGDPDLRTTEKLVPEIAQSGADIIELGVPFSDPLADGPTIQASSQRALRSRTSLAKILKTVKKLRDKTEVPLVLMTYLNPIYRYGYKKFVNECGSAGVDGIIVPDLIPEEAGDLIVRAKKSKLSVIFLATPTSSSERIRMIASKSTGFLYYVSLTGTTGERKTISESLIAELKKIRRMTRIPVACGFGISTPGQAKEVSRYADGVIVGSAIVKLIGKYGRSNRTLKEVKKFVSSLKESI